MNNELNTGTRALEASRDRLAKDIADVAGDASDVLKNFSERKLDSAKGALSQAQAAVTDSAREFSSVANEYVHEHPWKAMGAAAVAGVVLGLLLSRR